jgi:hypothetical protein
MNKNRKILLLFSLLLTILLFSSVNTFAQIIDPGCDPADPACPIDGGLSFLIAAGLGIGARKAFKKKG